MTLNDHSLMELAAAVFAVVQAIFGLLMVVGNFTIRRLVKNLDENTTQTSNIAKELHQLNLGLLANFVTKEEWIRLSERMRLMETLQSAMEAREKLRDSFGGRRGGDHGE